MLSALFAEEKPVYARKKIPPLFARGFDQQIWLRQQQPPQPQPQPQSQPQQQQQQQQQQQPAVATGGWGEWSSLGGDFLAFPC